MKKLTIYFYLFTLLSSTYSQGLTELYDTELYTIKHPNTWTLFKDDDLGESIHIVAPKAAQGDEFTENVSVILQHLDGINITLDDYVKLAEKQISENTDGGTILSSKRFAAGKIQSHKIIYKGVIQGFNLKFIRYYQLENEIAYILTYTALEKDFEQHKLIGQQILNSFRVK